MGVYSITCRPTSHVKIAQTVKCDNLFPRIDVNVLLLTHWDTKPHQTRQHLTPTPINAAVVVHTEIKPNDRLATLPTIKESNETRCRQTYSLKQP